MSPEEFIRKNIRDQLLKDGWADSVATPAANHGCEHFRAASHASRKGKMYDDCLIRAKQWAEAFSKPHEKPKRKKG